MRDLLQDPAEEVAAERAKVATEGWGARLLALQGPDGQWGRDALPEGGSVADPATRKLVRELQGVPLEELAAYLEVDGATLAAWEAGEVDAADERASRYLRVM